jgi:ATP-dependent Clp protease ATP-binding subunit ClpB
MFDANKVTQKTAEVINAASNLAQEEQHQQLSPIHLAIVLFEDSKGLAQQACTSIGGEEAYRSALRTLRKKLVRLPKIQTELVEVYPSKEFKLVLQAAGKIQKQRNDTYLGIDVLLLALIEDKEISAALSEAGVTKTQLQNAITAVRSSDMHVDSATGDENFQALTKYGTDLTANAARLDPVIGEFFKQQGCCLCSHAAEPARQHASAARRAFLGCTRQACCNASPYTQ